MSAAWKQRLFGSPSKARAPVEDRQQFEGVLRGLLTGQKLAVLATHDQAGPYASLVAFAVTDDLKHLVFATQRNTRKHANLTADPRVAMLIDSRSDSDADFQEAVAATAQGKAFETRGIERSRLLDLYLDRHPHLREFAASPDCALVCVSIERYFMATRFLKLVEIAMSS